MSLLRTFNVHTFQVQYCHGIAGDLVQSKDQFVLKKEKLRREGFWTSGLLFVYDVHS